MLMDCVHWTCSSFDYVWNYVCICIHSEIWGHDVLPKQWIIVSCKHLFLFQMGSLWRNTFGPLPDVRKATWWSSEGRCKEFLKGKFICLCLLSFSQDRKELCMKLEALDSYDCKLVSLSFGMIWNLYEHEMDKILIDMLVICMMATVGCIVSPQRHVTIWRATCWNTTV